MLSLIIICLSFHYRFILLSHYELVTLQNFVGYVQVNLNNIARAYLTYAATSIGNPMKRPTIPN
jgi:hypothetical protein